MGWWLWKYSWKEERPPLNTRRSAQSNCDDDDDKGIELLKGSYTSLTKTLLHLWLNSYSLMTWQVFVCRQIWVVLDCSCDQPLDPTDRLECATYNEETPSGRGARGGGGGSGGGGRWADTSSARAPGAEWLQTELQEHPDPHAQLSTPQDAPHRPLVNNNPNYHWLLLFRCRQKVSLHFIRSPISHFNTKMPQLSSTFAKATVL